VTAETPLDEKPQAELEISLDVTLGEIFDAACDAWAIEAGPDLLKYGGTRAQQFVRFAFVRPDRDAAGVDVQEGYRWPSVLPVARENRGVAERSLLRAAVRRSAASTRRRGPMGETGFPHEASEAKR